VTFRLAHLSDSHIGPLPKPHWRELMSKRLTGYVNWQRRGRIHNMDVLEAIVADLRAQSPDHIAMTGDILNIGLPAEFAMAADWLRTLGTPQDVSFVPGNHDESIRQFIGLDFGGIKIRDEHVHTTADGKKMLVLHGARDPMVSDEDIKNFEEKHKIKILKTSAKTGDGVDSAFLEMTKSLIKKQNSMTAEEREKLQE
jgi:3',5'-cyclic AMP phosphodiesterase CpdA